MGSVLIGLCVYGNFRNRPSLQWPKVRGVVMQSKSTRRHEGGRSLDYSVVSITYDYSVGDEHYVGHQIALWSPNLKGDGERAESFVVDHPMESFVEVYYDPQHHERAVLIPGPDKDNRVLIGIGVGLVVLSSFVIFGTRKIVR
jgi:hypothetical protein